MTNHKLWGGRFEAALEDWVEEFGASIGFDYRLAPYDLKGSLAHVKMLGQTGILTQEEAKAIEAGLETLLARYEAVDGRDWSSSRETAYSPFSKRSGGDRYASLSEGSVAAD